MIVATLSIGNMALKVRVPYAAGCSLVISAACHLPEREREEEAWLWKVQWGVVEEKMWEDERHCGLSGRAVRKPKVGSKYL